MRQSSRKDRPSAPKQKRRWVQWLFVGLLVLVITPPLVVAALCGTQPSYWRVLDAENAEIQRDAERVERSVTSRLTRVRPDEETWRIHLSDSQINEWLATRLPKWLKNRGIKDEVLAKIKHPMFNADGRLLRLAAKISASALVGVVQVGFEPHEPVGDGPVRLKLAEARIGRLPVSVDLLTSAMVHGFGATEKEGKRIRQTLDSIELRLPLGDGRRVDVVGLEPRQDGVLLSCRTVQVNARRTSE